MSTRNLLQTYKISRLKNKRMEKITMQILTKRKPETALRISDDVDLRASPGGSVEKNLSVQ